MSSCFESSIISPFIASFDTEYGIDTVGGKEPVVIACIDARADEMLMTRGSGERWSSGSRAVVRTATEVIFVLKWSLYAWRRTSTGASGFGTLAIAALFISTSLKYQFGSRRNEELVRRTVYLSVSSFYVFDSTFELIIIVDVQLEQVELCSDAKIA